MDLMNRECQIEGAWLWKEEKKGLFFVYRPIPKENTYIRSESRRLDEYEEPWIDALLRIPSPCAFHVTSRCTVGELKKCPWKGWCPKRAAWDRHMSLFNQMIDKIYDTTRKMMDAMDAALYEEMGPVEYLHMMTEREEASRVTAPYEEKIAQLESEIQELKALATQRDREARSIIHTVSVMPRFEEEELIELITHITDDINNHWSIDHKRALQQLVGDKWYNIREIKELLWFKRAREDFQR